jgi:hypothetical protein
MAIDRARLCRYSSRPSALRGRFAPKISAQVAELVDALASGASDLTVVKVRVLSWAPLGNPDMSGNG